MVKQFFFMSIVWLSGMVTGVMCARRFALATVGQRQEVRYCLPDQDIMLKRVPEIEMNNWHDGLDWRKMPI